VFFERCTVNTVTAPALRGELISSDCRLRPDVQQATGKFYTVKTTLGTRFANCTIHAPVINGRAAPELVNRTGFLEINRYVEHYHLNTALGNEVVDHFLSKGTVLSSGFITKLKSHYESRVCAEMKGHQ